MLPGACESTPPSGDRNVKENQQSCAREVVLRGWPKGPKPAQQQAACKGKEEQQQGANQPLGTT